MPKLLTVAPTAEANTQTKSGKNGKKVAIEGLPPEIAEMPIVKNALAQAQAFDKRLTTIENAFDKLIERLDPMVTLFEQYKGQIDAYQKANPQAKGNPNPNNPQQQGGQGGDVLGRIFDRILGGVMQPEDPMQKLVYNMVSNQVQTATLLNRALINSMIKKGLLTDADLT